MVPDPLVEFDILLALSNNLELHEETRQGSQDLRNRAAVYREHLIVSMVKSGRDEPKQCAVCLEELDAKQPSLLETGLKPRIVVLPCCHVFHHGCAIRWNARNMNCPTCRTPLGQLYHG